MLLKFRVNLGLYGAELEEDLNVVANFYGISEGLTDDVRNKVVPAGFQDYNFTEIDLSVGKYLIEVMLPTGQIISEKINVSENIKEITLEFKPEEQRFENLYHVQQEGEYIEWMAPPLVNLLINNAFIIRETRSLSFHRETLKYDLSEEGLLSKGYFFKIKEKFKEEMPLIYGLEFKELFIPIDHYIDKPLYFSFGSDYFWSNFLYNFNLPDYPRFYFFISGRGLVPQYSVLPLPWAQFDAREAVVEALVNLKYRNFESEQGFRISIGVKDKWIASILGYLGMGNSIAAEAAWNKIIEDSRAIEALRDKFNNPIAAAAGGYVLVNSYFNISSNTDWHDWIKNLMNKFKWLPDGAILNGWLKLNEQEDFQKARDCLLEGFYRGIPFYSKGVKMLLDGLTLFSKDDEKRQEIETAIQLTRELSLRMNPRETFTTILIK